MHSTTDWCQLLLRTGLAVFAVVIVVVGHELRDVRVNHEIACLGVTSPCVASTQ